MNPRLSIIVPVYNAELFIDRCVDSILRQTFSDFELILVDDGSRDKSLFKCEQWSINDSRVRVFHKENGGVSSARNMGLESARGEWIAFVDSDDWIALDMYELMMDKADKCQSDVVMCDINMFWGHEVSSIVQERCIVPSNHKLNTLYDYILSSWTCAYNIVAKKSLYDDFTLRFPNGIAYCEDFHLTVRLLFHSTSIAKVNKALYFYNRINESSAMNNLNAKMQSDRIWCDKDIINFMRNQDVLMDLHRAMSYRILAYTQEWVLIETLWPQFRSFYPESHEYIWSCNKIVMWRKFLMWFVAHNMDRFARFLLSVKKNFVKFRTNLT